MFTEYDLWAIIISHQCYKYGGSPTRIILLCFYIPPRRFITIWCWCSSPIRIIQRYFYIPLRDLSSRRFSRDISCEIITVWSVFIVRLYVTRASRPLKLIVHQYVQEDIKEVHQRSMVHVVIIPFPHKNYQQMRRASKVYHYCKHVTLQTASGTSY